MENGNAVLETYSESDVSPSLSTGILVLVLASEFFDR
jgi:hypothetical protein